MDEIHMPFVGELSLVDVSQRLHSFDQWTLPLPDPSLLRADRYFSRLLKTDTELPRYINDRMGRVPSCASNAADTNALNQVLREGLFHVALADRR